MLVRKKLIPFAGCILLLGGCASNQPTNAYPTEIAPTVNVGSGSESPESLYQLGRYYQGQNRFKQAIIAYKKALIADDGFVEAHNGLGVIYSKQGRYDEAVEEFNTALQKSPQVAHIQSNLGYTYYLQGRYEESVAALKQAITLDPNNQRARTNLGLAYAKAGKGDDGTQTSMEPDTPGGYTPSAAEVAPQADQQYDAWQQMPVKRESTREASGVIVRAGDSRVQLVQVSPAVSELRTQSQPAPTRISNTQSIPGTEKIRIEVSNGNGITGMARKVGQNLRLEGYSAIRLTNQKPFTVGASQIQYRAGYEEAAKRLQASLPVQPELVQRDDLRMDINVRLVLGKDLVAYQPQIMGK